MGGPLAGMRHAYVQDKLLKFLTHPGIDHNPLA